MKEWILTPDKYLDEEQAKKLRKVCQDAELLAEVKGIRAPIKDWAIIDTGLSSGLRVFELRGLEIRDLFLKRGQGEILVRKGKGGKKRIVKIGGDLKRHLKKFIHWKKEIGEPVTSEAPLFLSERGKKYTTRGIQKRFKKCARMAGLNPRYSIHCLRHTYGTMSFKVSGYNIRFVQKQLGHSNIQTTQVYADVVDQDTKRAVEAYDNLWK